MSRYVRSTRARWAAAGVLGIIVALAAFVVPVFGAEEDADRLRMTPQTRAFFHGSVDPASATTVQPVTTDGTKCDIKPLTGPLVTLSSNTSGAIKGPGYFDFGIGVKSGGSNGTPCSNTEGGERLTISTPNAWDGARLDVEVKGGVQVVAVMRWNDDVIATHRLATGTSGNDDGPPYEAFTTPSSTSSACAFPNDSGPDANIKDNCQWNIDPGDKFNSITLYAENGIGEISLEGGADYLGYDPSGVAAGMYDTIFYRAPVPKDPEFNLSAIDAVEDTPTDTILPSDLATDPDGTAITIESVTPSTGTVTGPGGEGDTDVSDGFIYTPPEDFCGTATLELSVTVSDENGGTATTTLDVNVACQADDDAYSMDAREGTESGSEAATLTVDPRGVLENDANDGDGVTAALASGPVLVGTVTPEGQLTGPNPNGSFTYTPEFRSETEWIADFGDATSYDVTWVYSAIYENQDPQQATVTITVNRNLCELDTVSDTDGDVFGEFTLLESSGCKTWVPVVADGEADTILFQPDSPDTTAVYDGTLSIFGLEVPDGSLATVILQWDPTPEEQVITDFEPIPSCWNVGGEIVLAGNPSEPSGWCFYDVDPVLVGEQLWDVTWKVRGWDDPNFSFR